MKFRRTCAEGGLMFTAQLLPESINRKQVGLCIVKKETVFAAEASKRFLCNF
jgi:hypothetical protein